METFLKFVVRLTKSFGLKREVAAFLSAVLEIARVTPVLQMHVALLETIAAAFGVVGVTHAATAGTVKKVKLSSLSSLFAVLVLAAHSVPTLMPFLPLLEKLAAIFGVAGITLAVAAKK